MSKKEKAKEVTKKGLQGIGIAVVAICSALGEMDKIEEERKMEQLKKEYLGGYSYGKALEAVINESDLGSCYIGDLIPKIKKGKDSSYYEAIIAVAKSNMSRYYKYNAIEEIC